MRSSRFLSLTVRGALARTPSRSSYHLSVPRATPWVFDAHSSQPEGLGLPGLQASSHVAATRATRPVQPVRAAILPIATHQTPLPTEVAGRDGGRRGAALLAVSRDGPRHVHQPQDRKSTRLNSSHLGIS